MTRETLDRPAPPAAAEAARNVRPVMLLTLNVELEELAIAFAIESAAEAGAELYICDAIPLEYRNYVGHVARQYAEQMNRKRAAVVQLQVLLETHLGDVAAGMIDTLYRVVCPGTNGCSGVEQTASSLLNGPGDVTAPSGARRQSAWDESAEASSPRSP